MPDGNLEIAVRVRTQLQQVLNDFRRLDQSLQKSGVTADRAAGRLRRLGARMDSMARGATVLGRHVRYLGVALGVYPRVCGGTLDALVRAGHGRGHRDIAERLTWRQIRRFWEVDAARRAGDVERLEGALLTQ